MSGRDVKKAVPVLKVHDGAALTRLHLTEEHSQLFLLALEAFLPSRADSSAAERDYGLGCPSTIWVSTSGTEKLVLHVPPFRFWGVYPLSFRNILVASATPKPSPLQNKKSQPDSWPVGDHSSFLVMIYESVAHSPVGCVVFKIQAG